jgi:hypothetical protein
MSASNNFMNDGRFSSITDGGYSTAESRAQSSDHNEMGSDDELFFVTSYSDFEKLGE